MTTNPANEDIGFHVIDLYRAAGGQALAQKIMAQKRAAGTTVFTQVHPRETLLRIELGNVDAGPVWATEILHARATGMTIDGVAPGKQLDQRDSVNYYIALLKDARNPENAEKIHPVYRQPDRAGDL
jgi:molybdate transport system substrate-binding protein